MACDYGIACGVLRVLLCALFKKPLSGKRTTAVLSRSFFGDLLEEIRNPTHFQKNLTADEDQSSFQAEAETEAGCVVVALPGYIRCIAHIFLFHSLSEIRKGSF